jgi:formylmethanofuran dehydrogenase subunit B
MKLQKCPWCNELPDIITVDNGDGIQFRISCRCGREAFGPTQKSVEAKWIKWLKAVAKFHEEVDGMELSLPKEK